jgi:hypothetical protein
MELEALKAGNLSNRCYEQSDAPPAGGLHPR